MTDTSGSVSNEGYIPAEQAPATTERIRTDQVSSRSWDFLARVSDGVVSVRVVPRPNGVDRENRTGS